MAKDFDQERDAQIISRLHSSDSRNSAVKSKTRRVKRPKDEKNKQAIALSLRPENKVESLSYLPSQSEIRGQLDSGYESLGALIAGRKEKPKAPKIKEHKVPFDKSKQDKALGLIAIMPEASQKAHTAYSDSKRGSDGSRSGFEKVYAMDGARADLAIKKKMALSLRYRIPSKLKSLDKKSLKKLSGYIDEQIERFRGSRTEMMEKIQTFREAWRNFDKSGLQITLEGQHDEHIPLIFEKGKAMHARLYQAVMGVEPPFILKPKKSVNEKQKQTKEDMLRWLLTDYINYGNGINSEIDKDAWNFIFDGTSIVKHSWDRDVRKWVDVEIEPKLPYEVDEYGQVVTVEKEIEKETICFDGPVMKCVPLEDVYIIGQNCEDIDQADLVSHVANYTKSDVVKLSQLGFFSEEDVEMLLRRAPSNVNGPSSTRDSTLKNQQERLNGLELDGAGIPSYRIYESYLRYDIDEDGIDEEIVVWHEENTGIVLRLTYLERVSPTGKRPFVLKKLIPVDQTPYGIGFGEMLYGINLLLDYIANQRLDAGTFNTFPWFVFRAASGMSAGDIRLAPGKGIPLDNINDIAFPKVNGNTAYGFQEEQMVNSYADRTSSINALAEGQIGGQGITRTASGAAALVQELNTQLEIYIQRYQTGFRKSLKIIDKQAQELLPLGIEYRVVGMETRGEAYAQFEDREAIRWDTDFELTGNSINSNKAIQRDTANQILQMQLNPIVLQSGIVQPQNIYAGMKNALQRMEIRDIDSYITAPQGISGSPFNAPDEINMILSGVKPPLVMNDDHQKKLAYFDEFEASPEFGYLTADHLPLYSEVKAGHQRYMEAIASQASLAGSSGMSNNPNLSAQITAAAGSGGPQGPVNQVADLLPQSSPLQNGTSTDGLNPGA